MTRETLPNRRAGETFEIVARDQLFTMSLGFYEDGRIGEVFLNAQKLSSQVDHDACDIAKLISFAIQFGTPLEVLAKAMTRDGQGRPLGLAGFVLDEMQDHAGGAAQ